MKELEDMQAPEVTGGATASPYPIAGSTPPYVPIMPGPVSSEQVVEQPLQNVTQ